MSTRHYKLTLETVGPVHIGNGREYTGKDYFKLDNKSVGVLDARRFVAGLNDQELKEYVDFLLHTNSDYSLFDFLCNKPTLKDLAHKSLLYKSEMRLASARRGATKYHEVKQCIKDAYGCPYIPGSSIKGMLRTALLTHLILADPERYVALFDQDAARGKVAGNAGSKIESRAFFQEKYSTIDGVIETDILRYVSVSDSVPLSTNDLVFVKKYDKFARRDDARHKLAMGKISRRQSVLEGNALDVYRECIRPRAAIELTLNIDDRIDAFIDGFHLDVDGLLSILTESFELYKRCFLDEFDLIGVEGSENGEANDGRCRYVGPSGMRCRNPSITGTEYCRLHKDLAASVKHQVLCNIGGGVDFNSKTVVNALFSDNKSRLREISHILYSQFPTRLSTSIGDTAERKLKDLQHDVQEAGFEPMPFDPIYGRGGKLTKGKEDHRHWKDEWLGVSPHTIKLGIVDGKKYIMGRCSITIEEER